jgi:predicted negative regulator of RcsB-dependent stress response
MQQTPPSPDLNRPDPFQQFLFNTVDKVYRHRQIFLAAGIAAVVGIFGFWFWQTQETEDVEAEANLFFAAQQAALRAAQQQQPAQQVQALEHYLEQAETVSLRVAGQLQLAEVFSAQKNWEAAAKHLQAVIDLPEAPDFSKNLARLNLAALQEEQQQWDNARQSLLQIDSARWDDLRLRSLARLALAQGKTDEARPHLEKLANLDSSPFQQEAADLLRQLR